MVFKFKQKNIYNLQINLLSDYESKFNQQNWINLFKIHLICILRTFVFIDFFVPNFFINPFICTRSLLKRYHIIFAIFGYNHKDI